MIVLVLFSKNLLLSVNERMYFCFFLNRDVVFVTQPEHGGILLKLVSLVAYLGGAQFELPESGRKQFR